MDSLQDTAIVPKPQAIWGWGERFCMPLYKPGTRVQHRGKWETVSHVALRRQELMVYLVGHDDPMDPSDLDLEHTVFTTLRVPEPR